MVNDLRLILVIRYTVYVIARRTPRRGKSTPSKSTPKKQEEDEVSSPPSQRRRTDTSPGPLPPSSPGAVLQSELPLFSSPRGAGGGTSEIDLSSPLNYGTPSSHRTNPRTPGAAGTPIRPRPDVRSERKMRTVNLQENAVSVFLV